MAAIVLCLTIAFAIAVGQVEGLADSCYPPLGCFSNSAPWTTLLRPVPAPKSPQIIDTRYYLYTRNAPTRFDVLQPSVGVYSVDGSDFNAARPTILFVHGLNSTGLDALSTKVKDALLLKSDANVIIVDWAKGSSDGTYFNALSNTRVVGATTIPLVRYLNATKGVKLSKVHCIGFSLGAHICGYVGKNFTGNIGRITALEAAQPFFENYDKAVRLDVGDAIYVDAIHTDARLLGAGFISSVGHSDFYVNGGWGQPDCLPGLPPFTNLIDFGNAAISAIIKSLACRHMRVADLFVSSMTQPNCRFWGHKVDFWQKSYMLAFGTSLYWTGVACDGTSCSEMGFDSNHYPARGSFDVTTATSSPYCQPDSQAQATNMASSYIP